MRLPVAAFDPPHGPHQIHERACKHCPAAHHPPDEEAQDIKATWPRVEQLATLFVCAWRPTKLCKGYCDYLEVTPTPNRAQGGKL